MEVCDGCREHHSGLSVVESLLVFRRHVVVVRRLMTVVRMLVVGVSRLIVVCQ